MGDYIYWHLPGFSVFRDLNFTIVELMKEFPNSFNANYKVGSVYGTFSRSYMEWRTNHSWLLP